MHSDAPDSIIDSPTFTVAMPLNAVINLRMGIPVIALFYVLLALFAFTTHRIECWRGNDPGVTCAITRRNLGFKTGSTLYPDVTGMEVSSPPRPNASIYTAGRKTGLPAGLIGLRNGYADWQRDLEYFLADPGAASFGNTTWEGTIFMLFLGLNALIVGIAVLVSKQRRQEIRFDARTGMAQMIIVPMFSTQMSYEEVPIERISLISASLGMLVIHFGDIKVHFANHRPNAEREMKVYAEDLAAWLRRHGYPAPLHGRTEPPA
ncbi:MAG TPA: hypothetical protein VD886_12120 [Herpetosiphonaceae bacterium]|nr:hypothetical protein [Herpetosiphonaceae bacterium]